MYNFFRKQKNKRTFKVQGMHCASCATMIESELEDAGFIAKCSYAKQVVEVDDNGILDVQMIKEVVKKAGYKLIFSR